MSEDGTADSATAPPASPASPASAPPAEATLADLVSTAAVDVPDAVALVHGDVRLTWAALEEEVARVAHFTTLDALAHLIHREQRAARHRIDPALDRPDAH